MHTLTLCFLNLKLELRAFEKKEGSGGGGGGGGEEANRELSCGWGSIDAGNCRDV